MVCQKCHNRLPEDSEYCQYCGIKIEEESASSTVGETVDNDRDVAAFLAALAIEQIEGNRYSQPNNETDDDFGLVPEKPIYTLGVKSVDGEKEYLNRLYTVKGEKIAFCRQGSISVNGISGIIDVYETFLPDGTPYETIYINMYGVRGSEVAPRGFVLMPNKPKEQKKQQHKLSGSSKKKEHTVTVISVICSAISILVMIVAMNNQDAARNMYEALNPTAVYLVLIGLNIVYSFAMLLQKTAAVYRSLISFIPALASIVFWLEGSLFSSSYGNGFVKEYLNSSLVYSLNIIWVCLSFVILFINITPLGTAIRLKWHRTVRYREKCYARVARMKKYLDDGIISQEEFERNKKDILNNIED